MKGVSEEKTNRVIEIIVSSVTLIKDVSIECEPPDVRWYHDVHSAKQCSPEYWQAIAKHYQDWISEFEAFIRDHRSQDPVALHVNIKREVCCSLCAEPWETYVDEDGILSCAYCGAPVKGDDDDE